MDPTTAELVKRLESAAECHDNLAGCATQVGSDLRLAAQRLTEPAQRFDYHRFLGWLKSPNRKQPDLAFSAGPERDAAQAVADSGCLGKPVRVEDLERVERAQGGEPAYRVVELEDGWGVRRANGDYSVGRSSRAAMRRADMLRSGLRSEEGYAWTPASQVRLKGEKPVKRYFVFGWLDGTAYMAIEGDKVYRGLEDGTRRDFTKAWPVAELLDSAKRSNWREVSEAEALARVRQPEASGERGIRPKPTDRPIVQAARGIVAHYEGEAWKWRDGGFEKRAAEVAEIIADAICLQLPIAPPATEPNGAEEREQGDAWSAAVRKLHDESYVQWLRVAWKDDYPAMASCGIGAVLAEVADTIESLVAAHEPAPAPEVPRGGDDDLGDLAHRVMQEARLESVKPAERYERIKELIAAALSAAEQRHGEQVERLENIIGKFRSRWKTLQWMKNEALRERDQAQEQLAAARADNKRHCDENDELRTQLAAMVLHYIPENAKVGELRAHVAAFEAERAELSTLRATRARLVEAARPVVQCIAKSSGDKWWLACKEPHVVACIVSLAAALPETSEALNPSQGKEGE